MSKTSFSCAVISEKAGDSNKCGAQCLITTAIRERLTRFPESVPHRDVSTYLTLSEQALAYVHLHRTAPHRLGVALLLCTIRYLGFSPSALKSARPELLQYLAAQLEMDPAILQAYSNRRKTRDAHVQALLSYLGFRRARPIMHGCKAQ
jgi:hypothetical protein